MYSIRVGDRITPIKNVYGYESKYVIADSVYKLVYGASFCTDGAGPAEMSKEGIEGTDSQTDWEAAWRALLGSFAAASVYTLLASWIPQIHSFPMASWVGLRVVTDWGWEVTPSMGYIGQGMIMGPKTAFSMLAGAVVGKLLLLRVAAGAVSSCEGLFKGSTL